MPKAKNGAPEGQEPLTEEERTSFASALEAADDQSGLPDETRVQPKTVGERPERIAVRVDGLPAAPGLRKKPESTAAMRLERVFNQDHDGQPPESMDLMNTGKHRHIPWGWILGGLGLVAVAAIAGFFFFNRDQKFTGSNIIVRVKTPAAATSGSPLTLTIQIQNNEPVDLVSGEVTIEYPEGFTYTSSSWPTSNEFKNAWQIGRLNSGRSDELTVTGVMVGALNSSHNFPATLTFRPANFNSDFQARGTGTVNITASTIKMTIDGPNKMAPGGSSSWTLTYTNTSEQPIHRLQIETVIPDGLTITAAKPVANERSSVWYISDLPKDGTGKIVLTGTATGSVGDSLQLIVKAGLSDNATVIPQDEQSTLIVLINTGLTTSLAVNGATTASVIKPGDPLTYTIQVANKSDEEVADITVAATVTGAAVDLTQMQNTDHAVTKDSTFTWTKKEVPSLALMKPGEQAVLRLTVGSKSALTVQADTDRDQKVSMAVVVSAPSLPASKDSAAATTETKIATVFAFQADARYYDDQNVAVGNGPLPPTVGKTTTYRVNWLITNTTSDASKVTISTILPTGVFWTGQNISREAGDIAFDPSTRTVAWTINTVPAGTGSRFPALHASFSVSITPTADQVGSVVVLTNTANASATDAYTASAIAVTQPSLTTAIPNDPKAAGQGLVTATY